MRGKYTKRGAVLLSMLAMLMTPCIALAAAETPNANENPVGYTVRSDNSSRYVASETDLQTINAMITEDPNVSLRDILLAVCPQMLYRAPKPGALFDVPFLPEAAQSTTTSVLQATRASWGTSTIQRYGASLKGVSTTTRPGGGNAYWLLAGTRIRSSTDQVYGYAQEDRYNAASVSATEYQDPPNGSYQTEGIHYYVPTSDPADHHYATASESQYISYIR